MLSVSAPPIDPVCFTVLYIAEITAAIALLLFSVDAEAMTSQNPVHSRSRVEYELLLKVSFLFNHSIDMVNYHDSPCTANDDDHKYSDGFLPQAAKFDRN